MRNDLSGIMMLAAWLAVRHTSLAQDSTFAYQGLLKNGDAPANGDHDIQFTIFDAATNGNAVGSSNVIKNVDVTNGLFAVTIDPGVAAFDGGPRWLEIGVRPGTETNAFIILVPRQALTAVPYATRAANFSGSIAASQLPVNVARLDGSNQVFLSAVQFTNPSNRFHGVFAGNGAGLSNAAPAAPGSSTEPVIGGNLRSVYRAPLYTHAKLMRKQPLTIWFAGDSVADEVMPGLEAALYQVMPRNGAVIASQGNTLLGSDYFRYTTNGIGSFSSGFGSDTSDLVVDHYYMAHGSVATWASGISNGVHSTTAELYYFVGSGFGTLLVETNSAGGAWGALGVVNANAGSFTGAFTNWNFPLVTNCRLRVTSSGTNNFVGFSLWNTNLWSGWRTMMFSKGGVSVIDYFNTTVRSNSMRAWLAGAKPDLVFVTAKEDAGVLRNGIVSLEAVLAAVSPMSDLVYVQCTPQSDGNNSTTIAERAMLEALAETYHRPIVDIYGYYEDYDRAVAAGLYRDSAHLNPSGQNLASAYAADCLGLNSGYLSAFGWTNRFVDASGKANLSGDNTFLGSQTITGNLAVTGYIISLGNSSTLALRDKDAPDNQLSIVYDRSAIRFQPSLAGFSDQLVSSNINGQIFLDSSTSYNGPPQFGKGNRWDIFANMVNTTNLTFTGTASGTPINSTTPAKWLRVTNDGVLYYLPLYQ